MTVLPQLCEYITFQGSSIEGLGFRVTCELYLYIGALRSGFSVAIGIHTAGKSMQDPPSLHYSINGSVLCGSCMCLQRRALSIHQENDMDLE